jgi:hypothetical protein
VCVDEVPARDVKTESAEQMNVEYRAHKGSTITFAPEVPSATAPEVSNPALAAAESTDHSISVTVLPSTTPGLVSVDGLAPLHARAVNAPMEMLASRFARVNLSAASLNISTCGLYESALSTRDNRDYIFESIRSRENTPSHVSLNVDLRPMMRDGATCDGTHHGGMHVAVSFAAMLALNTIRAAGKCPKLSPTFLYYNRKTRPMWGMHARDALRIMLKIGIAESSAYSWTGDDYHAPVLTEESLESAHMHRIAFYAAIASGLGLKLALEVTGACWILLPLFGMRPRFWCTDSTDTRGRVLGVQSAVVVGYDDVGFILTVWDSGWVGDRTMIFPYADWDSVIECWAAPVSLDRLRVTETYSRAWSPPPLYVRAGAPMDTPIRAHMDTPIRVHADTRMDTPATKNIRGGCHIM